MQKWTDNEGDISTIFLFC